MLAGLHIYICVCWSENGVYPPNDHFNGDDNNLLELGLSNIFRQTKKKRQGLALNITRFLLIIQIPIGQKRGKTFKNHRIWQSNNCSCQSFHSGRSVRYLHNVAPPR